MHAVGAWRFEGCLQCISIVPKTLRLAKESGGRASHQQPRCLAEDVQQRDTGP